MWPPPRSPTMSGPGGVLYRTARAAHELGVTSVARSEKPSACTPGARARAIATSYPRHARSRYA